VRVTNLENGRAVELRINDRGPFVEGRIIDVSFAAARSLRMITPGTARVSVERLDDGSQAGLRVAWAVQAGAFENEMRARELRVSLAERYRDVYVMPYESARATVHRVRVGPFSAHGDAVRRAAEIDRLGLRPLVVEEVVR
jgi:rare lipoprotein A